MDMDGDELDPYPVESLSSQATTISGTLSPNREDEIDKELELNEGDCGLPLPLPNTAADTDPIYKIPEFPKPSDSDSPIEAAADVDVDADVDMVTEELYSYYCVESLSSQATTESATPSPPPQARDDGDVDQEPKSRDCGLPLPSIGPFYMLREFPTSFDCPIDVKRKAKMAKKIKSMSAKVKKQREKEAKGGAKSLKKKLKKEKLSWFLKGLPGDDIDTPASESSPGLRFIVENPPVARKEILSLTTQQLAGFRLSSDPKPAPEVLHNN